MDVDITDFQEELLNALLPLSEKYNKTTIDVFYKLLTVIDNRLTNMFVEITSTLSDATTLIDKSNELTHLITESTISVIKAHNSKNQLVNFAAIITLANNLIVVPVSCLVVINSSIKAAFSCSLFLYIRSNASSLSHVEGI